VLYIVHHGEGPDHLSEQKTILPTARRQVGCQEKTLSPATRGSEASSVLVDRWYGRSSVKNARNFAGAPVSSSHGRFR
jgi:hypothetical protein